MSDPYIYRFVWRIPCMGSVNVSHVMPWNFPIKSYTTSQPVENIIFGFPIFKCAWKKLVSFDVQILYNEAYMSTK